MDKEHSRRHHKHSDHKGKRRHGDDDSSSRHLKKKHRKGTTSTIIDDDMDGDMWIEKNIDVDGQNVRIHLLAFECTPNDCEELYCSL